MKRQHHPPCPVPCTSMTTVMMLDKFLSISMATMATPIMRMAGNGSLIIGRSGVGGWVIQGSGSQVSVKNAQEKIRPIRGN